MSKAACGVACFTALALYCIVAASLFRTRSSNALYAGVLQRRSLSHLDSSGKTIPRILWSSHKQDLTRYFVFPEHKDNFLANVDVYQEAWENPKANFFIMGDDKCKLALKQIKSELMEYFLKEKRGSYRADICKLAMIHVHGGYYFDTTVQALEALIPDEAYTFVGVRGCNGRCIYPSFLASTPAHPIALKAHDMLLEMYRTGEISLAERSEEKPLAYVLAKAYESLSDDEKAKVYLLERLELDHVLHPYDQPNQLYPDFPRQLGHRLCNIVYHDPTEQRLFLLEHFLGSKHCVPGLIPHHLWFSHKSHNKENLLSSEVFPEMYENVVNTVRAYRHQWNETIPAPVHYLQEDKCKVILAEAYPALLPYYEAEQVGAFKGDICRTAALYLHGGYYFDVDLMAVDVFYPKEHTTFVSTLACGGGCFFHAFFASTPKHPILAASLQSMLTLYEQKEDTEMMGAITLANAYYEMPSPQREQDVELLEELMLEEGGPYPLVARRDGGGDCNYVVHDPKVEQLYFFARFLGFGSCLPKPENLVEAVTFDDATI